jgi:proteasome accessory factor A
VFAGQGKVSAENGAPPCGFQISQRADFIEVLTGIQTTVNRPVVNSRNEPLCGHWSPARNAPVHSMARLHVIFYDSTLCHISSALKIGAMQIILAMIEAEKVDARLILNDPVTALGFWSHDPQLSVRLPLAYGKRLSAIELQWLFLAEAQAFVDSGGCDGIVPEAKWIIELWTDTLVKLEAREFGALAPKIDWVLKLALLERAMKQRPELTWDSPEIKHLDHLYSELDGGLYWAYEQSGFVERVVSDAEIERFVHEPPADTRAASRARLLRLARPDEVDSVDWDRITFRLGGVWPRMRTVSLANPLDYKKVTSRIPENATTIQEAIDAMETPPSPLPPRPPEIPAAIFKPNTNTSES